MKKGILLLLLMIIPAFAHAMYVTDNTRVTFRTGPGNDHKILMMVNSGQELTVIETSDAWSKVKLPGGKEGWVMTRWLTEETPKGLLLEILTKKHDELSKKYEAVKVMGEALSEENRQLKSDLAISNKKARDCNNEYTALKADSANYLALKKEFEESQGQQKVLNDKMKLLNDQLTTKNIWWFVAGAGVLFFGIILGFSSRKKRRNSYL